MKAINSLLLLTSNAVLLMALSACDSSKDSPDTGDRSPGASTPEKRIDRNNSFASESNDNSIEVQRAEKALESLSDSQRELFIERAEMLASVSMVELDSYTGHVDERLGCYYDGHADVEATVDASQTETANGVRADTERQLNVKFLNCEGRFGTLNGNISSKLGLVIEADTVNAEFTDFQMELFVNESIVFYSDISGQTHRLEITNLRYVPVFSRDEINQMVQMATQGNEDALETFLEGQLECSGSVKIDGKELGCYSLIALEDQDIRALP